MEKQKAKEKLAEKDKNIVIQRRLDELDEKIAGCLEGKEVIAKYRRTITSIVTARHTKYKKIIARTKEKLA